MLEIGINRAVALLAEAKGAGRGRAAAKPLRIVGTHPADEAPIELYDGRYGPYVKHGGINATVPRDLKPEELTLEQAVAAARRARRQGRRQEAGARQEGGQGQGRSQEPNANGAAEAAPANDTEAKPKTAKKKAAPKSAPRRKAKPDVACPAPGPMAKGKVPTRDELLAFIRDSATPVGKREIARAFELKGDQRIELKELLRELRDAARSRRPRQDIPRSRGPDRRRRARDRAGRRRRRSDCRAAPARRGKGRPAAAHRDRAAGCRAAARHRPSATACWPTSSAAATTPTRRASSAGWAAGRAEILGVYEEPQAATAWAW